MWGRTTLRLMSAQCNQLSRTRYRHSQIRGRDSAGILPAFLRSMVPNLQFAAMIGERATRSNPNRLTNLRPLPHQLRALMEKRACLIGPDEPAEFLDSKFKLLGE